MNTKLTDLEIAELKRLMADAWPAPWRAHTFEIDCPCPNGEDCGDSHSCAEVEAPEAYPSSAEAPAEVGSGQCVVQITVPGLESLAGPCAAFIAAVRNALPSMLDEIEASRAAGSSAPSCAALTTLADDMRDCPVSHHFAGAQDGIVTEWERRIRAIAAGSSSPLPEPRAEGHEDDPGAMLRVLAVVEAAMNHMGDALNDLDAVEPEDEATTGAAFALVRFALGKPVEGDTERAMEHPDLFEAVRSLTSRGGGSRKDGAR